MVNRTWGGDAKLFPSLLAPPPNGFYSVVGSSFTPRSPRPLQASVLSRLPYIRVGLITLERARARPDEIRSHDNTRTYSSIGRFPYPLTLANANNNIVIDAEAVDRFDNDRINRIFSFSILNTCLFFFFSLLARFVFIIMRVVFSWKFVVPPTSRLSLRLILT